MGSLSTHQSPSSTTSLSSLKSHADREGDDRVGPLPQGDRGSERSQVQQLAVPWSTCSGKERSKQMGKLAALPTMRTSSELHPSQRCSSGQHQESKSYYGEASSTESSRCTSRAHGAHRGALQGDAGEGDRRRKNVHFARGVQDRLVEEQEEDHQGKGGLGRTQDSKDSNWGLSQSISAKLNRHLGEKVSHYNPETENLLQYLNKEEMESLRALAAQRAQDQSQSSRISDTELEPDYGQQ